MEENKSHLKHNLMPITVGFVLIVLVTAIFFLKSFFFNSKTENSNTKNIQNETDELNNYASISSADLLKKINSDEDFEILDIRDQDSFLLGHILGSQNINAESLAQNISSLDKNKQYYIVDDMGFTAPERDMISTLIKEGFKNIAYLEGGMYNWINELNPTIEFGNPNSITDQAKVNYISSDDLKKIIDGKDNSLVLVDVRDSSNFATGHIKNAINIPLDSLEARRKEIPSYKKIIFYDDNGILAFQGAVRSFDMGILNTFALSDGLNSWKKKGFEVVN